MSNSSRCTLLGYHLEEPDNAEELDYLEKPFVRTIAIIQLVICLFGTVGNTLSIVVLITNRSLRTIPNLYIGVLAVVDLMICILIPVSTVQILIRSEQNKENTIIDHIPCKIIGYVLVISTATSLFCMMLIAINRYILIIKGRALYSKIYTKPKSIGSLVIVLIWLIILTVIVPESGFGSYGYSRKLGTCIIISYCFTNYIYVSVLLSLAVFLPVSVVTGWAYLCIVKRLIKIRKKIKLNELKNLAKAAKRSQRVENRDSGVDVAQNRKDNMWELDDDADNADMNFDTDSEADECEDELKKATSHKIETHGEIYQLEDNRQGRLDSVSMRQPRKSIIRRLSPANIKVHSIKAMSKLRRPQWRRHCLAITKMITIYVVLWICWFPMVLQYLTDIYGHRPAYSYKIEVTLAYLNSAFNVLLYAFMNNTHRKAYKELLMKCCRWPRCCCSH